MSIDCLVENATVLANYKNKIDGLSLLNNVKDNSIATAFFDPQYRGVLDKLKYGNEGKGRGKARSELKQMDEETIINFIEEIDRVLKDSGHLFLWVDKFHLCQGISNWFKNTNLLMYVNVILTEIRKSINPRQKSQIIDLVFKTSVAQPSVILIILFYRSHSRLRIPLNDRFLETC